MTAAILFIIIIIIIAVVNKFKKQLPLIYDIDIDGNCVDGSGNKIE
jgi:hypothetical protein